MGDVKYIPPEQWNTLPVQPPAGLWHRRSVPWMVSVLATVAVLVIATLLIVIFRAQTVAWIVCPDNLHFHRRRPIARLQPQGNGALLSGTKTWPLYFWGTGALTVCRPVLVLVRH